MKNVLVIAYYFPPSGGPGVQRVLKHIRYLPEFGWNPVVLTVENGEYPARDESLLAQIPENVPVYRTQIVEPYTLYRRFTGKPADMAIDVNTIVKESGKRSIPEHIAEWIRATLFIPDARVGWLMNAIPTGLRIIREHTIQALYNSAPPYTTALIARALQRKTGLRWVTGLRDPWTGFISAPRRWFLPAAIDRHLERSVLKRADAVECAWQGIIQDALTKYTELPSSKFFHIPNGFDSNDYPAVTSKKNQRFTITYTGSMYGRRTPESFLRAVEHLLQSGEIPHQEINLRFIGRFGAEIVTMFEEFPWKESLTIVGYKPHEESIRELLLSDALLLVVDEAKESAEIVPGKVYEYIGSYKPVIAVAPTDGAVAALLRETQAGRTAQQNDIPTLTSIIRDYYLDWKQGTRIFAPNTDAVLRYERKNATRQLASLLRGTVEHL